MHPTRLLIPCLLASSALAAAGCAGESPPLDPDDGAPTVEPAGTRDGPPTGLNGLLPSCFWAMGAQAALRSLGGGALDQGGGALPSVPLSQIPAECRDVLRDTVQCALPEGQSLTDPVTGATYGGWWGLAAGWEDEALDTDGRRYVTACLVQRLNATGTEVPIVLEGPHPAIQRNAELASVYSIKESTLLGDLFSSTTPLTGLWPAFNVYSCWEDLLPQSCGAAGLPLLDESRVCDDLVLCGYVSLGPCSLACAQNGPYYGCKPGLLAPSWRQTVRVRVDPATCD